MSRPVSVAPGLHFVATPIGSARDITLRALDILGAADVIAAEDTRTARKLMEIHGIPVNNRPMIPYHDHNGAEARPRVLGVLEKGLSVAYVSEAGTPLVADPGYQLGRAAIDAGFNVFSAPGPSAALAALTVSGLASDRFLFAGFAPSQTGARAKWMKGLDAAGATVIAYESPKRIHRMLGELCEALGDDREVAVCRELTKRFEEVLRGTCGQVRDLLSERTLKGEIVVVIGRAVARAPSFQDVEAALTAAMEDLPLKAASARVAEELGMSKRDVYQLGLQLKNGD
ncbi:16S rRNA (cytidine(1402)-2'-O)-methyltransferase [Gymnodinialimonas ceratoperidinii]|uniref:Ribosomal RNA small subunit methyltransferase I n=1 Tax=Gymnodinialimonas ceratoperidinii TaxID=2856823 RepID=A0A8F6TX18_9RHOB|nr:16S rRNA (cytidine(1402)-2'-O)-methyltransferase [Gymnodinialimonas ceratoperidinii]QXT40512.1 16S rRNA (cytidine(1402)-2'-O)-methyltransferase [Gymnodinialimonas ceratoperidinii]